jgi:hypothetical protein
MMPCRKLVLTVLLLTFVSLPAAPVACTCVCLQVPLAVMSHVVRLVLPGAVLGAGLHWLHVTNLAHALRACGGDGLA